MQTLGEGATSVRTSWTMQQATIIHQLHTMLCYCEELAFENIAPLYKEEASEQASGVCCNSLLLLSKRDKDQKHL